MSRVIAEGWVVPKITGLGRGLTEGPLFGEFLGGGGATVNRHPTAHHPLDVGYYSVMDEPQLS